jgi:hypothetical protein
MHRLLTKPSLAVQISQEVFYYINPNKMYMLKSLFYLTNTLQVSGVTSVSQTTVTTASDNRYTVLLSAAMVE